MWTAVRWRRRRLTLQDPPRLTMDLTYFDGDLAEVAASLGSAFVAARAVAWGDARATLRVVLAPG
jgi:hypothetical protein